MTEQKKMETGQYYKSDDPELIRKRQCAKEKLHEINCLCPCKVEERNACLRKLIKHIDINFWIEPPFYCDYGSYLEIGKNFYANHNVTILDGGGVQIGNFVFLGPNVHIYTINHPLDAKQRNKGLEKGEPVIIKDNVWIGGNTTINPGVVIGKNSVIGSGSVVTKDIPDNVIAAGNPCQVIRKITDQDKIDSDKI